MALRQIFHRVPAAQLLENTAVVPNINEPALTNIAAGRVCSSMHGNTSPYGLMRQELKLTEHVLVAGSHGAQIKCHLVPPNQVRDLSAIQLMLGRLAAAIVGG